MGFCFKIVWVELSTNVFTFSANNNPAFQNAVEFLAVTCAIFVVTRMGFRDMALRLRGDSVTALTWSASRAFRKGSSFRPASAQMDVAVRSNVYIWEEFDFELGKDNYDTDYISRNSDTGSESAGSVRDRYPEELFMTTSSEPWLLQFLAVCNPEAGVETEEELGLFWREWLTSL